MMWALAVASGGAIGALLRWGLSLWLSQPGSHWPLGTLLANGIGAYAIGVLAALSATSAALSDTTRLFLMVGLLGGLTTFSTFSLEAVQLLQRQLWWSAAGHISAHVIGSLLLTIAGFATVSLWRNAT